MTITAIFLEAFTRHYLDSKYSYNIIKMIYILIKLLEKNCSWNKSLFEKKELQV